MFLLAHIDFTLPLEDPILKFLLILVIILAAPLILNKLKIPYLLGLIIAGAVIGPHGLNLVLRDSSIILSGTAGLLYIMFLSGLDMDMSDFRRNSWRSLIFGLYTFCVPLGLGILAGYYILGFSIYSSILLAGLFASQTLIAYPIVNKLGIARDKAVTIAVGGTVITDTLALLLLTVIVGMATGNVDDTFWWRLGISVLVCILIIVLTILVVDAPRGCGFRVAGDGFDCFIRRFLLRRVDHRLRVRQLLFQRLNGTAVLGDQFSELFIQFGGRADELQRRVECRLRRFALGHYDDRHLCRRAGDHEGQLRVAAEQGCELLKHGFLLGWREPPPTGSDSPVGLR